MLLIRACGTIDHLNDAARHQLAQGGAETPQVQNWLSYWPAGEQTKVHLAIAAAGRGEITRLQAICPTQTGAPRWWDVTLAKVANSQRLLVLVRDVTEFKLAEQRQSQARRLESIGRLTSGIAHDFNNLLTVVMSASESLAAPDCAVDERQALADTCLEAAERGADLVGRLLSFSRRDARPSEATDATAVMQAVSLLVKRTIPEEIALSVEIPQRLFYCQADRAELESALLNLCINSRDAMPDGGAIDLTAEAIDLDAKEASALNVKPGGFARFQVRDTGQGMAREVLDHAIEPFFTTKSAKGGSGLGLSSVHAVAEQSGGAFSLISRPGQGATACLYLPLAERATQPELGLTIAEPSLDGAHVLVVEDDAQVQAMAIRQLRDLGFRTSKASDGAAALIELTRHADIAVLLTDLHLPNGISGMELAARARKAQPDLRVLFTSGDLESWTPASAAGKDRFLAKPYRRAGLAEAVTECLAQYMPGRRPRRAGKARAA